MDGSAGRGAGGALFAGVMMILLGLFHAFEGLVGILNDEFYVQGPKMLFTFDTTTWGWTHLLLGLLVALVGLAILAGSAWARIVGIIMLVLSAIGNFLFLPHYPVWSILLIAIDVWLIWALSVWHPEEIS